jgi:hypothetical protein
VHTGRAIFLYVSAARAPTSRLLVPILLFFVKNSIWNVGTELITHVFYKLYFYANKSLREQQRTRAEPLLAARQAQGTFL